MTVRTARTVIHMTGNAIARKAIEVISVRVFVHLIAMVKIARRYVDVKMVGNVITFPANVIVHQDSPVHC